ncbi:hypothetical protein XHV734_0181 [Xanthomonas hortorum pv. vitians]|nr:hypothetical protein XHV734_0181 [Xanthomonas hortorum pv. vitians]
MIGTHTHYSFRVLAVGDADCRNYSSSAFASACLPEFSQGYPTAGRCANRTPRRGLLVKEGFAMRRSPSRLTPVRKRATELPPTEIG